MATPTMTAAELADELGRSTDWLYDNWPDLCRRQRMPRPLHGKPPLVWQRAQIYAWLDRSLTREQRISAAAYRAALDAAQTATGDARPGSEAAQIAEHRARLDARFARSA